MMDVADAQVANATSANTPSSTRATIRGGGSSENPGKPATPLLRDHTNPIAVPLEQLSGNGYHNSRKHRGLQRVDNVSMQAISQHATDQSACKRSVSMQAISQHASDQPTLH